MLQDFRHDLSLRTRVLLAHGSIDQASDVSIEMSDEILTIIGNAHSIWITRNLIQTRHNDPISYLKVFLVSFWSQSITTNPFDGVP